MLELRGTYSTFYTLKLKSLFAEEVKKYKLKLLLK